MKDSVPCMWLPLWEKNVLLPSAAIVEIAPFEKPKIIPDVPKWFLGIATWRAIHIPLTMLEAMESHLAWNVDTSLGILETISQPLHMAVLNRAVPIPEHEGHETIKKYPFFSMVVKGTPKMFKITPDKIEVIADTGSSDPRFLVQVKVQNEIAFIPNLPGLWGIVDALPSRLQWFKQLIL